LHQRTCDECLFFDVCDDREVCCGFYPADDDQFENDMIEIGRIEFRKEWFDYISECE